VIQRNFPDGDFDLDCASLLIAMNMKDVLWILLEKHSAEVSETKLTFIEEVQLIALKKSKIDIVKEIGQRFIVDAAAKKIRLLESVDSTLLPKKEEELNELRRYQEALAFNKPSVLSNIVQRLVHPLFSPASGARISSESTNDARQINALK
jgi:hypothetical protein